MYANPKDIRSEVMRVRLKPEERLDLEAEAERLGMQPATLARDALKLGIARLKAETQALQKMTA
jgi:hypothetical protein